MQNLFSLAFKVSRFRFWIYTAGTYVVGYALGVNSWLDLLKPECLVFLLYFFFPANIFLYGVNDYWDQEVDLFNPKKGEKEYRMNNNDRKNLKHLVYGTLAVSLLLLLLLRNVIEQLIFASFLLLSYFYSAKPLRFKAIPFLDFASNALYIVPGILGYYQVSGTLPPTPIILAGFMHTSAMQIFSAIPDIEYDRKANLVTTAVILKKRISLTLTLVFWVILELILIVLSEFNPLSLIVTIYPAIPFALLIKKKADINKVYWIYPYVNTILGGLLFVALLISKTPASQLPSIWSINLSQFA